MAASPLSLSLFPLRFLLFPQRNGESCARVSFALTLPSVVKGEKLDEKNAPSVSGDTPWISFIRLPFPFFFLFFFSSRLPASTSFALFA